MKPNDVRIFRPDPWIIRAAKVYLYPTLFVTVMFPVWMYQDYGFSNLFEMLFLTPILILSSRYFYVYAYSYYELTNSTLIAKSGNRHIRVIELSNIKAVVREPGFSYLYKWHQRSLHKSLFFVPPPERVKVHLSGGKTVSLLLMNDELNLELCKAINTRRKKLQETKPQMQAISAQQM